jgi:EAL domain-containing protein (putative c-di-GMP-specific phosphodiesterase class I)
LGGKQYANQIKHYQPKIDLQTSQVTGMETLLRWQHPERGMLLPSIFVTIAEECGLILHYRTVGVSRSMQTSPRVERFGARGCTGFGERVRSRVPVQRFSVRSSGRIDRYRVEPQNLELELTETVLMQDAESAVVTLLALKAMGVRLAIDD